MENMTLLEKAKAAGLNTRNIEAWHISYAKEMADTYSRKTDEDNKICTPKSAEKMALRYLELVSHPDYRIKEQITISDKFKEELRGRHLRIFDKREKAEIKEKLRRGHSVKSLMVEYRSSSRPITIIRDELIANSGIEVKVFQRGGQDYRRSEWKKHLTKEHLLNKPILTFGEIQKMVCISNQTIKQVWLEMVRDGEIDKLLKFKTKHKFTKWRSLRQEEIDWIHKQFADGKSVEKLAFVMKCPNCVIERVLPN